MGWIFGIFMFIVMWLTAGSNGVTIGLTAMFIFGIGAVVARILRRRRYTVVEMEDEPVEESVPEKV